MILVSNNFISNLASNFPCRYYHLNKSNLISCIQKKIFLQCYSTDVPYMYILYFLYLLMDLIIVPEKRV